jgi:DNA primase
LTRHFKLITSDFKLHSLLNFPIFAHLIKQETIQQITSRIDVVEIVGEFVKLKKRGANYMGLCPFHNEKSPSFTVSPAKEIYKCFGCGKSGNAISFLMEHEKYSYVEALRWLAAKYNVEVEETEVSAEYKQSLLVADSLHIINKFAQQYFETQLFDGEEGQLVAMSYLKERGFRDDIMRKFGLGYCLDSWDAFAKTATEQQYSVELLAKTGLVKQRDDGGLYDTYKGRIIFPVHNQSGKVIGFGARIIKSNDKQPKYINTPENEVYVKSKLLYGTYFARMAIDKADECLLVEGYTDVISMHQAGIENVVASGGTSLTPDQLRLVKKYTNNLTIVYDGDSAGVKAAMRGLDLALEEGLNVRVVLIPDGEDPDSYVKKVGSDAFRNFVQSNKKDFVLFQLEVLLQDAGADSVKKSQVVNQVAETLSKIDKAEDFTKQQDFIRQCSVLLKIDEGGLTNLVNKFKREKLSKQERKQPNETNTTNFDELGQQPDLQVDETLGLLLQDEMSERSVVRCLLQYGYRQWDEENTIADLIYSELLDYQFDNGELNRVVDTYRVWYEEGLVPTEKNFLYHEDKALSGLVVGIMDFQYELSPNWDKRIEGLNINNRDVSQQDVLMSLTYFKLKKIKHMIQENQKELEQEKEVDKQITLMQVHKELKQIEKTLTQQMGTVILK